MKNALTIALGLWLSACGSGDPAALMQSAKNYMAKRDFAASVIELKNVLQKAPDNAEARYLLGVASLEQGDVMAAQIELDKARELGLKSDALQLALARVALAKGDVDGLLARFAGEKLSDPKAQAELRASVALAYVSRNRRDAAREALDEALALDNGNVTANLGAARLAALSGNLDDALSRVERALAASPGNVDSLVLKAELLAARGESAAAEEAYRNAVAAAPNLVALRVGLITQLLRQRALEKAAVELAALEKAAPKDPRTFYAKALLLTEQNNFAGAKEAILQVLKVAPEHVPSLILAGMAALESGALQEAESHLRKAVFNAPQALGAKRLLAATHLRMGKTELALSEVGELLKVTKDPAVAALAGEAYLAAGDFASAARQYEQAKALAPKNPVVQTRLAIVRFAAGEPERAVAELESASANDPNGYQADLALITNYLRQRQAEKALAAIVVLEKKQPRNPLTYNLRGGALMLKNDVAGARASFEKALELEPTYMPAVSNLVQLDIGEKKPEAARKRYEAVLKKEPNNEQALLGLAVLLRVSAANPQDIEKLLKQSVAANPSSPVSRIALINFYLRAGDAKAALGAAQEAQAALANDASIVQALGTTQIAAGEPRQAVASFTRLAEMLPKSAEAQIYLARAQVAAKQPDEAVKALRAALALRPDLGTVERDIAAVYVSAGRFDDALREAKAVQAEQPKQPLGYVLEAEVYVAQKRWSEAERTYRQALKKFDLPALAVRSHGVLTAAGKPDEADALAQAWVKAHPKDASVLGYLGERDLAGQRYERAAERYRAALERQPDSPLFLNNLAWIANQLKQPDALQYAERAHELAPQNPSIMDTLGWILVSRGQTDRGIELLGRAAELAPQAYEIRLNFAKALLKGERKAAARKELEVLAKLDARLPVQKEAAALLAGL